MFVHGVNKQPRYQENEDKSTGNKYFELITRGAPTGRPKLELLASNGSPISLAI